MKKTIAGKEYDYTLCSRCNVWILTDKYSEGTHKDCDQYLATRGIRERAEARALGTQ